MVTGRQLTPAVPDLSIRWAWGEMLSRVPWSYFLTLTLDPKKYPRSGPESWASAWRWFLFAWLSRCAVQAGAAAEDGGRLRGPWINAWRKGRGQPMWVLALEPHRDDRLHAHVLLKLTRDLPWLDYKIGQRLWQENRGICWFEVPESQARVTGYVTKYVVKSCSDSLLLSENFSAPRMASY